MFTMFRMKVLLLAGDMNNVFPLLCRDMLLKKTECTTFLSFDLVFITFQLLLIAQDKPSIHRRVRLDTMYPPALRSTEMLPNSQLEKKVNVLVTTLYLFAYKKKNIAFGAAFKARTRVNFFTFKVRTF